MSGNIITGTVLVVILALAIRAVIKNRQQGKCCGCDGDCHSAKGCPFSSTDSEKR